VRALFLVEEKAMWWILLACMRAPPQQVLEEGEWTLLGDDVYGVIRVEADSCDMEIWGDGFHAANGASPCLTTEEEGGHVGVSFALEMGAGGAQAYGELSPDLSRMRVPLGSREGDFEAVMDLRAAKPDPLKLSMAREASEKSLLASKNLWNESVFRLVQDEALVGELFLPDEGEAQIQLYAPEWMTRSRVPVSLVERGPDLWLSFEVMPSFDGELGLLIVNRPSNRAVVPISGIPLPGEIRMRMTGGPVEQSERALRIEQASSIAVERELQVVGPKVEQVHELLESMGCPLWETVDASLGPEKQALYGYRLASIKSGESCRLTVEPKVVQHGRRVAFRVDSGGGVEHAVRSPFFE
jgi:hypothetical protein